MIKDGFTWYWCKWHERWDTHCDQDCRARKKHQRAAADKHTTDVDQSPTKVEQSPTKVKSAKQRKNKTLSLAKALIAMSTGADGHDSISNSDDDSV